MTLTPRLQTRRFETFTYAKSLLLQVTGRSSGTVIPPPLVRGGQHIPSKHNSQIVMPPLVRGAQVGLTNYDASYMLIVIWEEVEIFTSSN